MSDDTLNRWRGFVQKVTGRLTEIMNESNGGFEGLLQDPGLDPITFVNAMNAIEIRYKDLRTKLANTYSEQVVLPTVFGGRGDAEKLLRETEAWMENTWEHFRTTWNGKLVRTLWGRVGPMMHKPVNCSRCGGALTKTLFHAAESITCPSCKGVNSVAPDPLVYTYFALAPDMIADEATIQQKLAIERAMHGSASRGQLDAMWREYFTAFVRARATVAPMDAAEQQHYVDQRVKMIMQYR
jgi:phage FluMu protein Com